MKKIQFEHKEDWLHYRAGKITGTRLKDLIVKRGTKKKIGFYEIIAERIAIPITEDYMLRGAELEADAIARFEKETKKKVDSSLVLWEREDDPDIAISPDGSIGETEAIEVKCLSNARHLEAYLTQTIPPEFEYQILQYFIVNDKIKKLHFVFYNPAMPIDYFSMVINRKDIEDQITECLEIQREALKEIEKIQKDLTF
ncbi:MAG: YqaJ viral recombinase family protein [Patescibacteria group bacterium]|jgi:hypothetical protein|nr:YqaJ viral recombinase family protein [Patescibacteria group bacterium]